MSAKEETFFEKLDNVTTVLFYTAIGIALFVGWCINIYKLSEMTGISGMLIIRAVGIFILPVGGVLGYF